MGAILLRCPVDMKMMLILAKPCMSNAAVIWKDPADSASYDYSTYTGSGQW